MFRNQAQLELVDYCGMVSGRDSDKGSLFTTFYGELRTVPMISECPVNLECQVVHEFSIEHRQMFIARVVQTYIDSGLLDTRADQSDRPTSLPGLERLKPIIYSLDNRYYSIGEAVGEAYSAGKLVAENRLRGDGVGARR